MSFLSYGIVSSARRPLDDSIIILAVDSISMLVVVSATAAVTSTS